MAHHHHDAHEDTYYLDQLCMIALAGAFGGICLSLYFWQTRMLKLLLGPQFHDFVLYCGGVLMVLALVRAAVLWKQVGEKTAHDHDHHHDHEHSHSHEHAHDHGHDHDHCDDHCHDHDHSHAHGHGGHGDDHDHSWAPWRYVVMLVPVIFFLLGLPNKGPQLAEGDTVVDTTKDLIRESAHHAALVAMGPSWEQLGFAAAVAAEYASGPALSLDFKTLEGVAADPGRRDEWKGKSVRVRGQFARNPRSDRVFNLVRLRIQCCAADVIPLNVPIISREGIQIPHGQWVDVTGRIDFRHDGQKHLTVLLVPGRHAVTATDPDPNPYIQ